MKKLLKLEGKKSQFFTAWTIHRPSSWPAKVTLPLKQSTLELLPCVEEGERVLTGQKIAGDAKSGFSLCASVSGKISRIFSDHHPVFGRSKTIEILSDGLDEKIPGFGKERVAWEKLKPQQLLEICAQMGLSSMTLNPEPLAEKLERGASALILNACESQPYLASNYCLMMSRPLEILKGAEILRSALGLNSFILVTQEDQHEAAELLKSKIYFLKWEHVDVLILPSGYPDQETVLARRLQQPGAVVLDLAAVYAVYEAVVLQKPLIERTVTIAGECVMEPKNVQVRLGTDLQTIFKYAKGFMREPRKVIIGGPLSGLAVPRLDCSLPTGGAGLLALPAEIAKPEQVEPCIRCGKCLEVCPVEIAPAMISLAAENDLFQLARDYGAGLCIECGNCSYVCPSKRPLVELIQYAGSAVNNTRPLFNIN